MDSIMNKIIFGIRHKRQFQFIDKAGRMADDVLSLNKTVHFLGEDLFTEMGWADDRSSFQLQDSNKDITLNCNTDGIVLTVKLDSELETTPVNVKTIFGKCVDKIINKTEGNKTINRIGVVYEYLFSSLADASKFIGETFLNVKAIGDPTEVGLRFTVKNPLIILKDDVKHYDYHAAIFQIASRPLKDEDDKPSFKLSIDFQIYFTPEREYEISLIEDHFKRMNDYVETLRKGALSKVFVAEKANG